MTLKNQAEYLGFFTWKDLSVKEGGKAKTQKKPQGYVSHLLLSTSRWEEVLAEMTHQGVHLITR